MKAGAVVVRLDDGAVRAAVAAAEAGGEGGRGRPRAHEDAPREGRGHPARARADDGGGERRPGAAHRGEGQPLLHGAARPLRGARGRAPREPRRRGEPRHAPHRDRGRGRPRDPGHRRVRDRRDPASRLEAPGAGGRPAGPPRRHRDRGRPLGRRDHAPLRAEGRPARRPPACARGSSRACSSPAWPPSPASPCPRPRSSSGAASPASSWCRTARPACAGWPWAPARATRSRSAPASSRASASSSPRRASVDGVAGPRDEVGQ